METYATKASDIKRRWFLVDAEGAVLGRLASKLATVLRGKDKPLFVPYLDLGDNVIVVNAEKVRLTGKKESLKTYYHHSGYPGGLKAIPYKKMKAEHPERIVEKAVKGMLPRNTLGRQMLGKLHIYAGPTHPHVAQKPEPLAP